MAVGCLSLKGAAHGCHGSGLEAATLVKHDGQNMEAVKEMWYRKKIWRISVRGIVLERISKMWIRVQGKARGGEKAQHTR